MGKEKLINNYDQLLYSQCFYNFIKQKMTIKMRSQLNLNNSQSPKVQMRRIIISRGTHRQASRQINLNNDNSSKINLKFNPNMSKTSFFQDDLLINPQQKQVLTNKNTKKFNFNKQTMKRRTQTRLSSSLSRVKDTGMMSSFSSNQQQKVTIKSNGSSLSLRRDSVLHKEQTDLLPQMTVQNMHKILDQLQKKLGQLIKNKLYFIQNKLKLKNILQNSSKVTDKQHQSLLKLVQTQQFEIVQAQIQKVQRQLSGINLDLLQSQNNDLIIKLRQTKSKLIEQILAQRMVECQLYKKYYLGSRSVDKVKHSHLIKQFRGDSQQLFLNRNKLTSINRSPKKVQQIQSQSKISFKSPKTQDYETYRYKQPLYKPNLQPIPRSVYKAQYLKSSPQQSNQKPTFIQNMIFGKSQRQKSSSYRDAYNRIMEKQEPVNHKELDAYKDKFRDIKLSYMPKKRTHTQEATRKAKRNHTVDYLKQLKSTKLFALQSQRSTYEMNGLQPLKQSFLSQIKRQYDGSQGLKSLIRHKQLANLRYQFKKMFHS